MIRRKEKKAAIELSIGTVVIIVLAMTMLILGLVLVRNIFSGATNSVDEINSGVESEIKELFQSDNDKAVIYLTDRTARVDKGESYGVAFGVRNTKQGGGGQVTEFSYVTNLADSDAEVRAACGVTTQTAESWLRFGNGDIQVSPGEVGFPTVPIRIEIPENAPLCTTRYTITIRDKTDNTFYAELGFILEIS